MLQNKIQLDYTADDFIILKDNFNLNMISFANAQTNLIRTIPKEVDKISELTEYISNIAIISGNSFFFKKGNDLKVISSENIVFDKILNTFKLKSTVSYKLEPKENKIKLITDKGVRIYDKDKTKLKSIGDLLVRQEAVNLHTTENFYKYTLSLGTEEIKSINNIRIELNEHTQSYPNISEIYYLNHKREKISVRVLNSGTFSYNLDYNKNTSNIYSIDIETIESDNLYITLEDVGNDLIINKLNVFYTEYEKRGSIILEALSETLPILKVGVEGEGDLSNVSINISHDMKDWKPITFSNTYTLEQTNKILSYNTISSNSIKTQTDVKTIYIKIDMTSMKESIIPANRVDREIHSGGSFNVGGRYDSFALYSNENSINYGKLSTTNIFNYADLYKSGEYVIIDNMYYVKGFLETITSKVPTSPYNYTPVSLKTKAKRVSGEVIPFNNIDISTKELYTYKITKVYKNLLDSDLDTYVLPLKDEYESRSYYLRQNDTYIEVDLSLGYINSAIDVLYAVVPDNEVTLLDEFKKEVMVLDTFEVDGNVYVSLLDMFKGSTDVSKVYPLHKLRGDKLGLLDNKYTANNLDRELNTYILVTKKLYANDVLSSANSNYSNITSTDDYQSSFTTKSEVIPIYSNQYKFKDKGIVRGSIRLDRLEVPYINGYKEFEEVFSKEIPITINKNGFSYEVELVEDDVIPTSISYTNLSDKVLVLSLTSYRKNRKTFLSISSTEPLLDINILVAYSYRNTNTKNMYSINYPEGIIHFSEETRQEYRIEYKSDHILCYGKDVVQLTSSDYIKVDERVNIVNYKENSTIFFVYKEDKILTRNTTPLLTDLRVNYIIKDNRSL